MDDLDDLEEDFPVLVRPKLSEEKLKEEEDRANYVGKLTEWHQKHGFPRPDSVFSRPVQRAEGWTQCIFDESHFFRVESARLHYLKCRPRFDSDGTKSKQCPHNDQHLILADKFAAHLENCESKPDCVAIVDFGYGPATRELDSALLRNLANQQKQEAGTETETPLPKQWKVGDRCLFHWKMDGLWYQSAIKEITTSGDYVIVMDHSQEVHKTSAPFEIKEQAPTLNESGSLVTDNSLENVLLEGKWLDNNWYPISVLGIVEPNSRYLVEFQDFSGLEFLVVENIRQVPGTQTFSFSSSSWQVDDPVEPLVPFEVGALVRAKWEDGEWYNAKITEILPGKKDFRVHYTDYGNDGEVKLEDVEPLKTEHPPVWMVGDLCEAKWSEDGQWYDAEIVALLPDEDKATVSFLEYGNSETVSLGALRTAFTFSTPAVSTSSPEVSKKQTPRFEWKAGFVCSGKVPESQTWKIVRLEKIQENGQYTVTFIEDSLQVDLAVDSLRALTEKEIEHLLLVKPMPGSSDFTKPTEKTELFWECTTTIYDDSRWLGTAENKSEAKRLSAKIAFELGTDFGRLSPFVPGDLPTFQISKTGAEVLVTDNGSECDKWIEQKVLKTKARLLGFDTEWYVAGQGLDLHFKLAIIQLATENACLVFSTPRHRELPPKLIAVLQKPDIELAGVSTSQDELYLQQQYHVTCEGVVDISELATQLAFSNNAGTRRLAASFLGVYLEKDKSITVSKWNSWPLSQKQIEYAAADALIALQLAKVVYEKLGISKNTLEPKKPAKGKRK